LEICGEKSQYLINKILMSILTIPLQAFGFGTYELTPCQTNSTVFLNRLFLGIVVLTITIRVINEMRIEHHKEMSEREIAEKKRKP
jgi:large-conductance mechanosensitive channel